MNVRRYLALGVLASTLGPVTWLNAGTGVASSTEVGDPLCTDADPQSDYPPSECTTTTTTVPDEPTLDAELTGPVCDLDVPYLRYRATAEGVSATATLQITFVNPDGADYVVSGLPLAGRILWPGAVVDGNGRPVDWPGWTQRADGTWVVGDEWDWVRSPVTVVLHVNPSVTRTVSYPQSTPPCTAGPRDPQVGGQTGILPMTR